MYTMTCLLVLQVIGATSASPSWTFDYGRALQRAEAAKKPVAVFIGSGKEGWKSVCEEGNLSPEAHRLLADRYVCVYLDADQQAQQKIVRSFEPGRMPLLVVSTGDRKFEAYRHSGKITNAALAEVLRDPASHERSQSYTGPASVVSYEAACRT
jgi:hypothetical protein